MRDVLALPKVLLRVPRVRDIGPLDRDRDEIALECVDRVGRPQRYTEARVADLGRGERRPPQIRNTTRGGDRRARSDRYRAADIAYQRRGRIGR